MSLQAAKSILVQDRMDWNKPHLTWIPEWNYRIFRLVKRAKKS